MKTKQIVIGATLWILGVALLFVGQPSDAITAFTGTLIISAMD